MDRNHVAVHFVALSALSLSARRAWIEIRRPDAGYLTRKVALRKESVDRNVKFSVSVAYTFTVALRKESVDRNIHDKRGTHMKEVALRKESVDRNGDYTEQAVHIRRRSPQGERG